MKNTKKHSAKKVTILSKSRRSVIAKKAANSAWKTMRSTAYKRAAAKGRKAVTVFLANRRAA